MHTHSDDCIGVDEHGEYVCAEQPHEELMVSKRWTCYMGSVRMCDAFTHDADDALALARAAGFTVDQAHCTETPDLQF